MLSIYLKPVKLQDPNVPGMQAEPFEVFKNKHNIGSLSGFEEVWAMNNDTIQYMKKQFMKSKKRKVWDEEDDGMERYQFVFPSQDSPPFRVLF